MKKEEKNNEKIVKVKSSLNAYHQKWNKEGLKRVKEMLKNPLTIEEARKVVTSIHKGNSKEK